MSVEFTCTSRSQGNTLRPWCQSILVKNRVKFLSISGTLTDICRFARQLWKGYWKRFSLNILYMNFCRSPQRTGIWSWQYSVMRLDLYSLGEDIFAVQKNMSAALSFYHRFMSCRLRSGETEGTEWWSRSKGLSGDNGKDTKEARTYSDAFNLFRWNGFGNGALVEARCNQ